MYHTYIYLTNTMSPFYIYLSMKTMYQTTTTTIENQLPIQLSNNPSMFSSVCALMWFRGKALNYVLITQRRPTTATTTTTTTQGTKHHC